MSEAIRQLTEPFPGLAVSLDHTLPAVIAATADALGDKPFIVAEDGSAIGFTAFRARVRGLAQDLIDFGINAGDRIAIWAPNSPGWIIAASAAECIGAVVVPINTRFKGGEASYVLARTRARILFTVGCFLSTDYTALLREAGGGAGADRPVQALPNLAAIRRCDLPDFAAESATARDCTAADRAMAAVTPATIADILFTSGTTGQPKGAMHNHGQALWMVANWNRANDLKAADGMLVVNPFFHSFGYRSGWVSALAAGMTVYPIAAFDAEAVLRRIEAEKITVLMGAPTVFTSLLDHPDFARFDLSSLRVGHTGAANVPVDLIRAGRERFGFDLFLTSFGQTESSALITVNGPDADLATIAGTVGRPLPGVELRIIDAAGNALPQGEGGELLVRGPNVMQGYFEEPEQTAETIDADGWLHTGDVGCIGEDGTLRILDRLKDIVIVGGFNAYPAEIENILRTHPAIDDAAVLAWPDARMGEVCAACIILRQGATLPSDEFAKWARAQMANYKVPRHLFTFAEFPRTPLGKVQKFQLRELAEAQAQTLAPTQTTPQR